MDISVDIIVGSIGILIANTGAYFAFKASVENKINQLIEVSKENKAEIDLLKIADKEHIRESHVNQKEIMHTMAEISTSIAVMKRDLDVIGTLTEVFKNK
jgi:hypothetical protein